jgi:hypothetical protein
MITRTRGESKKNETPIDFSTSDLQRKERLKRWGRNLVIVLPVGEENST